MCVCDSFDEAIITSKQCIQQNDKKKTGNICKVRGRNPIKVQQQYLSTGPDENHDVTKSRYTMYAIKIRTGHIANAIPER